MAEKFSYDKSVARIQQIISDMQDTHAGSVDQMLANVETATKLIAECQKHLTAKNEELQKMLSKNK